MLEDPSRNILHEKPVEILKVRGRVEIGNRYQAGNTSRKPGRIKKQKRLKRG